jgi:hypothetical protein
MMTVLIIEVTWMMDLFSGLFSCVGTRNPSFGNCAAEALRVCQVADSFPGEMATFGGVLSSAILVMLLSGLDVTLGQSTEPSEGNFCGFHILYQFDTLFVIYFL